MLFLSVLVFVAVLSFSAQPTPEVITPDNLNQLQPAYYLPGCDFSPNGRFVWDHSRIYDLESGSIVFSSAVNPEGTPPTAPFVFSPDGRFFAANADGVYDTASSENLFSIDSGSTAFSPDSQLAAVADDGVYDLQSGERLFGIGSDARGFLGTDIAFSPDGRLLVVEGDAVYDVRQGQRLFEIGGSGVFSPDSNWLYIRGGELFDTRTWDSRFIGADSGHSAVFSQNSQLIAVSGVGVLDVVTGVNQFPFGPNPAVFSPDDALLAVRLVGVYRVGEWDEVLSLTQPELRRGHSPFFSPDGDMFFAPADGVYETTNWERLLDYAAYFGEMPPFAALSPDGTRLALYDDTFCTIYSPADDTLQQRFGVVIPLGAINVRQRPSTSGAVLSSTAMTLAVTGQNADASWFRVDYAGQAGWVSASAVEIVFLPDDLPVE